MMQCARDDVAPSTQRLHPRARVSKHILAVALLGEEHDALRLRVRDCQADAGERAVEVATEKRCHIAPPDMYREVMRARWCAQRQLDGNELPQLRGGAIVRPGRSVARLLKGVKLVKMNAEPPSDAHATSRAIV